MAQTFANVAVLSFAMITMNVIANPELMVEVILGNIQILSSSSWWGVCLKYVLDGGRGQMC